MVLINFVKMNNKIRKIDEITGKSYYICRSIRHEFKLFKMNKIMRIIKVYPFMLSVALMILGCQSHDMYDDGKNIPEPEPEVKPEANTFDFSTVQNVRLAVDYSKSDAGSVFFSIYAENPFTDDDDPALKEGVTPIYESFTDLSGKFNSSISLPAYAKHLYVYTGNFFVSDKLIECDVVSGSANVTASGSRAATRDAYAMTRGTSTSSLATLAQLSWTVDWKDGSTVNRIYKDWHTPLGTWDNESGKPDYLMKSGDPDYDAAVKFTSDELKGIKQAISLATTNKQSCPEEVRLPDDLKLKKASKVAVTVIGSNTCWNNTVGYYYYPDGETPTIDNLNIIMLFPNTQDGKSDFIKGRGNNYYGNIALTRETDVVMLKYYPNIASGSYEGATTIFPAGTRIGFILKSNGWGMQKSDGDKKFYNSYKGDNKTEGYELSRQYNSWAATTDGLSYYEKDATLNKVDAGAYTDKYLNNKAHAAKFAYQNANGDQYAIITFEDACNDDDFDDFIIAMKPVGVFEDIPVPDEKTTAETGVYAYEDLWPNKGDYDMNDAVLDYKREFYWKTPDMKNVPMKIFKETIKLTTYQNYVTLTSGLAVTINGSSPNKVTMKTVSGGKTNTANFAKEGNTYFLTDDITGTIGTTFVLELQYDNGIADGSQSTIEPFIYRTEEADDKGKSRWEVHLPFYAPTSKMKTSYFGTGDDCSDPSKGLYYVRSGDYPFAFFLSGVTIEPFKSTILLRANEKKPISDLYPKFLEWSTSKGEKNSDWYLK